jgi:hypothetical protein
MAPLSRRATGDLLWRRRVYGAIAGWEIEDFYLEAVYARDDNILML